MVLKGMLVDGRPERQRVTLSLEPPMDWRLTLELGPDALRALNPLASALQMLMQLPGLHEQRARLSITLAELFSNALEHGLLGLDSAMKHSPDGFARYYARRKIALQSLTQGRITIDYQHVPRPDRSKLILRMADTGSGFDHRRTLLEPEEDHACYGRGIRLVRSICENLSYAGDGNQVEAVYTWDYTAPAHRSCGLGAEGKTA